MSGGFWAFQEKFKQSTSQIPVNSFNKRAMKFLPGLRRLLLGANSKTGIRVEQWKTVRTTVKSERVTVVSEEVIINHRNPINYSADFKTIDSEPLVPMDDHNAGEQR